MADRGYPMLVVKSPDEEGGGYMAYAPDLRGCMADGDTPEAAILDLVSAIEEWIDEAVRLERAIPLPGSTGERSQLERKELEKLVSVQQRLIEAQDQLLQTMRDDVAQSRKLVDSLSNQEEGLIDVPVPWIDRRLANPAAAIKKPKKIPNLTN